MPAIVLFLADVARALAVGALSVLAFGRALQLWELYAVTAALGIASAFAFQPSTRSSPS